MNKKQGKYRPKTNRSVRNIDQANQYTGLKHAHDVNNLYF